MAGLQQRELYSISCNNLEWKRIWKRKYIYIFIYIDKYQFSVLLKVISYCRSTVLQQNTYTQTHKPTTMYLTPRKKMGLVDLYGSVIKINENFNAGVIFHHHWRESQGIYTNVPIFICTDIFPNFLFDYWRELIPRKGFPAGSRWVIIPSWLSGSWRLQKNPPANSEKIPLLMKEMQDHAGLTPGVGRFPWSRVRQPSKGFLPRKSQDRGAWRATAHSVATSWARLRDWAFTILRKHFLDVFFHIPCLWTWN